MEVLDVRKENDIRIDQNDASTKLLKKGLYDFDVDHQQIRVLRGAVEVHVKDQNIKVTDRRALALSADGKLKAQDYDTLRYEDDFFRWSALRSGYLSEAALDQARVYIGPAPAGTARVGIGTHGLVSGRFFLPTESSTARSDGDSTRRSSSIGLPCFTTAIGDTSPTISASSTRPMDMASSRAVDFTAEVSEASAVRMAERIAESCSL